MILFGFIRCCPNDSQQDRLQELEVGWVGRPWYWESKQCPARFMVHDYTVLFFHWKTVFMLMRIIVNNKWIISQGGVLRPDHLTKWNLWRQGLSWDGAGSSRRPCPGTLSNGSVVQGTGLAGWTLRVRVQTHRGSAFVGFQKIGGSCCCFNFCPEVGTNFFFQ